MGIVKNRVNHVLRVLTIVKMVELVFNQKTKTWLCHLVALAYDLLRVTNVRTSGTLVTTTEQLNYVGVECIVHGTKIEKRATGAIARKVMKKNLAPLYERLVMM